MIKNKVTIKSEFLEKQQILENARTVLKKEFIGINKIIDEVIDNFSSWFFLSDIQEKPIVINLWGLTGVGKTSLVGRLVELVGYSGSYYRFDLGEKEGNYSFRDSLDDLCDNKDDSPVVIALDEFQHSRTVSGMFRQELENDKNRMIWELLDSGKVQYFDWRRSLWMLESLIKKLVNLINAGVEVQDGIIMKNVELYCKEMDLTYKKGEKVLFVSNDEYDTIIELAGNQLGLNLLTDVEKLLLSYDATETIVFLNKVLKIGKRPSIKSFTKALIFVLGNLDEAYAISDNFSADIDADEFNKISQKITVPKIKSALQTRFRNEQIARLGNIHIIYPALSRFSYQKIISNELADYAMNLKEKFGISIEFDNSINEIIYNEGVYPTQGVRPIFTSIHQVLKSKVSIFLSEVFLKSLKTDRMRFSIRAKELICQYFHEETQESSLSVKINTSLDDMRRNRKDDIQAITSVHESGHAVLSIVLLKTIPDVIYSITTDSDNHGFVYSSFAWDYVSRKEVIPRVAMFLGGYVAEELIYGKENLTSGAANDIEKATAFLSTMYKYSGMGSTPISYSIPIKEENESYHKVEDIESEIKNAIEEALVLAKSTLKKEMKMLLTLSDYLSDNRMLKKNEIKRIADDTMRENVNYIENGDHLFYRDHLKKQIKNSDYLKPSFRNYENAISLNKLKSK